MDHYSNNFQSWNKLATAYQEKFMDMDLYNDSFDVFLALIEKQNAKILEIGCGPGNITKYLLAKRPDLQIEATDISPNMIELAQANNSTAHCRVMDARDISALGTKFDAIMCGFCMPYLAKDDCAKLVKDCSALMDSGGIIYISTIEDDHDNSRYETSSDGQHRIFVHYPQAFLEGWLKENDLEIVSLLKKVYPRANRNDENTIIFIARKK